MLRRTTHEETWMGKERRTERKIRKRRTCGEDKIVPMSMSSSLSEITMGEVDKAVQCNGGHRTPAYDVDHCRNRQ